MSSSTPKAFGLVEKRRAWSCAKLWIGSFQISIIPSTGWIAKRPSFASGSSKNDLSPAGGEAGRHAAAWYAVQARAVSQIHRLQSCGLQAARDGRRSIPRSADFYPQKEHQDELCRGTFMGALTPIPAQRVKDLHCVGGTNAVAGELQFLDYNVRRMGEDAKSGGSVKIIDNNNEHSMEATLPDGSFSSAHWRQTRTRRIRSTATLRSVTRCTLLKRRSSTTFLRRP